MYLLILCSCHTSSASYTKLLKYKTVAHYSCHHFLHTMYVMRNRVFYVLVSCHFILLTNHENNTSQESITYSYSWCVYKVNKIVYQSDLVYGICLLLLYFFLYLYYILLLYSLPSMFYCFGWSFLTRRDCCPMLLGRVKVMLYLSSPAITFY